MAQKKVNKKAAPAAKRPAAKPAAKKAAAKPAARKPAKPVKKAAAPASKSKPAKKSPLKSMAKAVVKAVARATGKAKPAPATKAVSKPAAKPVTTAVAKPAQKPAAKSAAKSAAKPAARRPVAVSHRPQAAVAVQPRAAKTPTTPARSFAEVAGGAVLTEDQIRRSPDSAYMNDAQLAFFQDRLVQMRNEVLTRELDVKERLHQREVFADPADRASAEEEHWLDLRLRERESLLLKKIDEALRRIRDREYGYCEKTGEQIGIARLLARPTATVCVDIKGQTERAESQYRDR